MSTAPKRKPDSPPADAESPNRILIVDDEEPSRDLCRMFLESDGYVVETCDRGDKAIAMLESKRFDLLLTDLSMPDMDGVELVKQVKYHYPSTNVVIMTAFGSVASAVESMKSG